MALDLSKLNIFSRLNARSRVFVLLGGVLGFIFIIYFGTRYLSGGNKTTGPSRVANAPQGMQSVPGGQLTPEYYRAVEQANATRAQQAQISGGSAVNTMLNMGGGGNNPGCIICTEQTANVKDFLDDWVKKGAVAPDVAAELEALADKNVPVDDYAAELNRLVKEGKLTPEQARLLLEQYKKQHANALLADSAKTMDAMIKAGQLPLDAANQLLDDQKKGMTPAEYAAELQRLVREGKISPETAARLLAEYTRQRAREIIMQSIAFLNNLSRSGQLTPDVLKDLIDLENRMVPLETYSATLQKYIAAGKLVPAVAGKVYEDFQKEKAEIGPSSSINQLLKEAEAAAYQEISDLLKAGKITQDVATLLTDMIQRNVSLADYEATVNKLVQENRLTPAIAKLKIADYTRVKQLRDEAERLANLLGNNASAGDYADELKRAVAAGILTPEEAAQLMREYQAAMAANGAAAAPTAATTEAFAALQQRVAQGANVTAPPVGAAEFATAQAEAQQETAQDRQARLDALAAAMSGQAQQLVAAWQPPTMQYREGTYAADKAKKEADALAAAQKAGPSSGKEGGKEGTGEAPLIKAGTIIFGVLDTAVNSDYPDAPVLVTIVEGKYKGSKLLGKLTTAKSVSGQLDRISLNFTLMNKDDWLKSKTVTAFAIDPDTARTVLASEVNYHYMLRYGAIMATSFVQGYATAIMTSASTSTTGIFGTSTTHPELSPSQKLATAIGQIGTNLGSTTQNYINIPPTVRVDSGVGLGILFMADVT